MILTALLFGVGTASAADHIDSPGAVADPTADITDLYAWTNANGTKVNVIMNVGAFGSATGFSTAVSYAFEIESSSAYGVPGTRSTITCEFYDSVNIECWGPGVYVTGDASDEAGISNDAESLKVFAGPRNDPFFMESNGFGDAVELVVNAGIQPDGTCPAVDGATSNALLDALTAGGSPVDTFAGTNVQSLVVQFDKALVDEGGPILAINAATYVKSE